MANTEEPTVYVTPVLPLYYIVRIGDEYWLVPALENGWRQRRPYLGGNYALRPVFNRSDTGRHAEETLLSALGVDESKEK